MAFANAVHNAMPNNSAHPNWLLRPVARSPVLFPNERPARLLRWSERVSPARAGTETANQLGG